MTLMSLGFRIFVPQKVAEFARSFPLKNDVFTSQQCLELFGYWFGLAGQWVCQLLLESLYDDATRIHQNTRVHSDNKRANTSEAVDPFAGSINILAPPNVQLAMVADQLQYYLQQQSMMMMMLHQNSKPQYFHTQAALSNPFGAVTGHSLVDPGNFNLIRGRTLSQINVYSNLFVLRHSWK